jgi:hypothetical protein
MFIKRCKQDALEGWAALHSIREDRIAAGRAARHAVLWRASEALNKSSLDVPL